MDLVSKKCGKNNNPSPKLTHMQNTILMRIVVTPEKYSSFDELKSVTIKVRTSSVKSSSTLLSFSVCAVYNIVRSAQKRTFIIVFF